MRTLQDFIIAYNLQDELDAWSGGKTAELTPDQFLASMQGKTGKTLLDTYEIFWIAVFGKYTEDGKNDYYYGGVPDDLLISRIILPTAVYFEPAPVRPYPIDVQPSPYPAPFSVKMTSSLGFDIRLAGHFNEAAPLSYDPITLSSNRIGKLDAIAGIAPDSRIYIPAGSVVDFMWDSNQLPAPDTVLALTLAACKVRDVMADTVVLKGITGLWYATDSIFGDVKEFNGADAEEETAIAYGFIETMYADSESTRQFLKTYITATDGILNYEPHTLTIKNRSDVARVLVLKPLNGEIQHDKLPNNVTVENGNLVIEFAPGEGV